MFETIISSSILIVFLILLRYLFMGKINPGLQYFLWLLVAIRLLMPFPLFDSPLSVLNVFERGQQGEQIVGQSHLTPMDTPKPAGAGTTDVINGEAIGVDKNYTMLHEGITYFQVAPSQRMPIRATLKIIWLAGVILFGLWFIIQNIRFYTRLRKTRWASGKLKKRIPVYLSRYVKSPCLFGFKPSVYIHPDSTADVEALKFILAHEETHYRHGDHLWSCIRCICLALHWFNPLVWWAAVLSRRDCEIACDESTLNRIGDEHRKAYGNTLINMIERSTRPSDLLLSATTMTSGKAGIKERITMIAQKPKMAVYTFIAILLVTIIVVGCTFTGAKNITKKGEVWLPQQEIEDQDEYWEALRVANESVKNGEISVENLGSNEEIANAWMNGYLAMLKALPKDNMAYITEGTVDRLDIKAISKEGLPKAFVFAVTYSVRPTYPIARNSFWMAGNTGNSPGRDETWGQMYREVELGIEEDGWYHFVEMGTGGVGMSYDFILLETPLPLAPGTEPSSVTLYERSGVTIAIPNEYMDQLLIDPIKYTNDDTLIMIYQKSTYEKYDGMGFLFGIIRFDEAQFEQLLSSADGSGLDSFAKDDTQYYVLYYATDVQAPDDSQAFGKLFAKLSNYVKEDLISRNGLTPFSEDELRSKKYTYESDHITLNYYPYLAYNGSKDVVWTLTMSQPVKQGDKGIWCVERWEDENGNRMLYFPDENGVPSAKHYASKQAESDAGIDKSWLDPKQAALKFVKKAFEHAQATVNSFSVADDH